MSSTRSSLCALSLLVLSLGHTAMGTEVPPYTALRKARPEETGVGVQQLVLQRDAFKMTFTSGTFFFLSPIQGRTVGAVFIGDGSYELKPTRESERRHLSVALEEKDFKVLSDRFDKAVLLFTDDTAAEIRKASGASAGVTNVKPDAVFERYLKRQKKDFHSNFQLRLLSDLLAETPPSQGAFLAFLDGKRLSPVLLAIDPQGIESLGLASDLGDETVALYSPEVARGPFLYLSGPGDSGNAVRSHVSPVDALHYTIDTTIKKNTDVEGTTTLRFRVLKGGIRVLPFELAPKLRLRDASFALGEGEPATFAPLPFIQEDAKEDPDAAVVFPSALAAGDVVSLRLSYAGEEILENFGDGNFAVRARQSWYPNVGTFSDPATFDLTYRVPKKNEVLSVGTFVESQADGDRVLSRWKADAPIRVAGFNYGRFKKLERTDPDSGFTIRVYTNPGTPSIARELQEAISATNFSTDRLAEAALADGINTARTCNHFFGALPYRDVSITQQTQWSFGQSWPSLIYLPYLAFLGSTTRMQLGLSGTSDFVDQVGLHEFAHQWWGHHVGWGSYRDQWLSEGFAEFTAALVLQQTGGNGKYREFWEKARKTILSPPFGRTISYTELGPIADGFRLESERTAGAYSALVYSKGAYVLHMLRMMMLDPKPEKGDAAFIAMMKDFTSTYAGKSPTTLDFQHVAERHMTPGMDPEKKGSLDWFFREWVQGTEIPRYKHTLKMTETSAGKYHLTGDTTQSDVSADFRMPVSIYAEFDGGGTARLGTIILVGNTTSHTDVEMALPKKPKRIVLNAMRDVLSRD